MGFHFCAYSQPKWNDQSAEAHTCGSRRNPGGWLFIDYPLAIRVIPGAVVSSIICIMIVRLHAGAKPTEVFAARAAAGDRNRMHLTPQPIHSLSCSSGYRRERSPSLRVWLIKSKIISATAFGASSKQ